MTPFRQPRQVAVANICVAAGRCRSGQRPASRLSRSGNGKHREPGDNSQRKKVRKGPVLGTDLESKDGILMHRAFACVVFNNSAVGEADSGKKL